MRVQLIVYVVVVSLAQRDSIAQELSFERIDFSPQHNANLEEHYAQVDASGVPVGEVELGGIPFLIPARTSNYWNSLNVSRPNPRVVEIPVAISGVTEVHTLINSQWGIAGPGVFAHLEFEGSGGAYHRFDLLGNENLRDWNDDLFTNRIQSETTTEVWSSGHGQRIDKQRVVLPPEFATQDLAVIRLVDNGYSIGEATNGQRQRTFLVGLTVVRLGRGFVRGDVVRDGSVNIGDAIAILDALFRVRRELPCADAADVDDNGELQITDAIGLLGFLFLGTLPPRPPFESCGHDSVRDDLECEVTVDCV